MRHAFACSVGPLVFALLALGCGGGRGGEVAEVADAAASPQVHEGKTSDPRAAEPRGLGVAARLRAESARDGFMPVPRGGARLALDARGFLPTFDAPATASLRLPRTAAEPFRLAKGDLAVTTTLLGARASAGVVDEDVVVYEEALPAATLIHVPIPEGTEEYVRFTTRPSLPELRYRLSFERVAGLRLVDGEVLELLSSDGNPVLRTTAPTVLDARGRVRRGTLELEGCAADTSAAAPWGRPVVAPSADGCTLRARWNDDDLAYPLLVDPPWTTTGALATKRREHRATTIRGSTTAACATACVLATGGLTGTGAGTLVSAAELYNAATGTWASAGSTTARRLHAQADLRNGVAIVAGGATTTSTTAPTATTTAQQYNPASGWTTLPSLPAAIWWHGAATVRPGEMWVSGGFASGGTTAQAAVYTFKTASPAAWGTQLPLTSARAKHVMAPLETGTSVACGGVFVAGGVGASATKPVLASVEFYSFGGATGCVPSSSSGVSWPSVGTMVIPRHSLAAAVFNRSNALLVGGEGDGSTVSTRGVDVVAFNAGTAKVETKPLTGPSGPTVLSGTRADLAAATVESPRLRVLAIGGRPILGGTALDATDVVDPVAGKAYVGSPMGAPRAGHVAVPFSVATTPPGLMNRVLVVGGWSTTDATGFTYPATDEVWAFGDKGSTCKDTDECATGTCVDGVCCDRACTGTCEACNEPGSVGTCKTVAGAPRGSRPTCPMPSTPPCGYTCDGINPSACVAPDTKTSCGVATCAGGVSTAPPSCDSAGACKPSAVKTECGGYPCGADGTCATTCTDDATCAKGYVCTSGKCTPRIPNTCSADVASTIPPGKAPVSCGAYRCDPADGECREVCSATEQCAPGYTCNTTTKVCEPIPASSGDEGGCATRPGPTAPGAMGLALGVLLGAVLARRRLRGGVDA